MIPEVFGRGELQPVKVAAQGDLSGRFVDELDELVAAVHQIVERELRVDARRRQDLKERAVLVVGGVVVAGAAEPACSQPGGAPEGGELIAHFRCCCRCAVALESPVAVLERAPAEEIECAGADGYRRDDVCAVGSDADVSVIGLAEREGAVVGLRQAGSPVVIAEGEGAPEKVIVPCRPGEGEVLQVDVQLGVTVHVEDTLIGAPCHGAEIPCAGAVVGVDAVEAALGICEAEVADQALGDAVGLQPGERRIFGLRLESVDELESAEAKGLVFAGKVVACETLFEEGCCGVSIVGVRRIVGSAQTELTLGRYRRDGIVWEAEDGGLTELQLPVPVLDALSYAEAQQRFDVAVGLLIGGGCVPLRGVNAGAVKDGDGEREIG